jgi:hypothetical protein
MVRAIAKEDSFAELCCEKKISTIPEKRGVYILRFRNMLRNFVGDILKFTEA